MPRVRKTAKLLPTRPLKPIDWDKVDELLYAGCSAQEIAGQLCISADTLADRVFSEFGVPYTEYSQPRKRAGESLIRKKQYDMSMKGNTQLLLRLGEERLGQGKKNAEVDPSNIRTDILIEQEVQRRVAAALLAAGVSQSDLATQQPILDQGQAGQEDPVQDELGTEGIV